MAAPQRMDSKITHKQSSHMNELVCNNQNVDRKEIENEQKMELSETAMVNFSQTDNPSPKDNNSLLGVCRAKPMERHTNKLQ